MTSDAFQALKRDTVESAADDEEGPWAVVWMAHHLLPEAGADEIRALVLTAVLDLLRHGEIRAGPLARYGVELKVYAGTPEEIMSRIRQEWDDLGREPSLGDIAYFVTPGRLAETRRSRNPDLEGTLPEMLLRHIVAVKRPALAWLVYLTHRRCPEASELEVKQAVMAALAELLEAGPPSPARYHSFRPWHAAPSEVIADIERAWEALGREPTLREIAWIAPASSTTPGEQA